eukprot:Phypoly_transcript_07682.p1 GENE.Phypoly_transcript_07682~~Phypoly_transcript_07682.p1  ORF type:complete len:493 (+),score=59.92 Phypoly_transcript_07682:20-1498(+)
MVATVLIALLVIAFAWLYKKIQYKHPALLAIPSATELVPFFGSVLGIDTNNYNETVYKHFEKTNEKVTILWIFSRPIVFVADATLAGELMRDERFLRQGDTFDLFYFTMGDALFSIDGPKWKERRAQLNHSFGPIKVRSLFPIVQEHGVQIVEAVISRMEKQGFVDMDELLIKTTLNIIHVYIMSKDYQIMTSDPHKIDDYFQVLRDEGFRLAAVPFWKYLPAPSRIKFFLRRQKFNQFFDSEIHERMEYRKQNPGTPVNDAMDVLVNKGLPIEEIRVELIGLIFAGHDTTAHTAAFALHELTKPENKRIFDKLMQEIDSVIPNSSGISRVQDVDDLKKLGYLSAIIKEVLRLYPIAVAHPLEPQEDVEIGGYKVPKGYAIHLHYYSTQRLSKYWKDPLVFNPDRWLDQNSASATEDYSSSVQLSKIYMPFLFGPHVCIGQHLAQLEMKVLLATLLKNLTFSPKPGSTTFAGTKVTLCPVPGVYLLAKKREV